MSLSFDGANDYIDVADSSNLRFDSGSQDFSIAAWILKSDDGVVVTCISKLDGGNDGWEFHFLTNGALRLSINSLDITSDSLILVTNGWTHVCVTVDRDGNGQTYINGVADGSTTSISGEVMATTAVVRIGGRSHNTARRWNGKLDDVRVYNKSLSAAEVEALYKSTRRTSRKNVGGSLGSGLVGHWQFQEKAIGETASGTNNILDRSGNSNHGSGTDSDSSFVYSDPARN